MRLTKKQKLELLGTVSYLLNGIKAVGDMKLFKYEINTFLEEKDFLALKDIKTQLSNDIFCKR